jgi:hypothetical protein
MPLGDCTGRAAATGLLGVARGRNLPHGQGRRSTLNGPPLNMAVASGNAVRTTTYTKHETWPTSAHNLQEIPLLYRIVSIKRQCVQNYALRD